MKRRFRELVDRHRHRIYTFAYYHLGNHEEAEDVAQEVLVRLWKSWEGIDPGAISAWITRVTRNACIDALRKRSRYRTRIVPEADCGIEIQAASTMSAETVLEAVDFREQLERAIASLDEPYRTIVILREVQEMKYEEISDALEMPLNTIKVYLHRARGILRNQLREETDLRGN